MGHAAQTVDMNLSPITRPNGKLYRPRKIVVHAWDNYDDAECGVIVFGTHDAEQAREPAHAWCRYWFGTAHAINAERVWLRDAMEGGERRWRHDDIHGRAGVSFTASDDPEETP